MHERAHDPFFTEKRKDVIIARDMPVLSHSLGVRGACDVVEFRQNSNGVALFGREGLWLPCPIEYKRGKPKKHNADKLQLCTQAICLEEMLLCPPIPVAYLFYGETKRREEVTLDNNLRETVKTMFSEMRAYYARRYTPRVKPSKGCANCSMNHVCLPKMPKGDRVSVYIKNALAEDTPKCAEF
jgi:CRISPR-associated exonuclease Cas4